MTLPAASAAAAPRFEAWLARLCAASAPRDYRRAVWTLACLLGALALLVGLRGPCLQVFYGHDAICFLAGAWRVRQGQWPHADYHSALGALNPWLHAAGMSLLGPTATVLPVCAAAVAAALGALAWAVARTRLPAWPALGFAFTQGLVALAPHLLRSDWVATTYACYYNRQGYALVSILMLVLFLPRTGADPAGRGGRRDGLYAGAILAVLLFQKVSYFAAGVGLCAVACGLGRRSFRTLLWPGLAAFALVAAACLPLIRGDVPALLDDYRMAAAARGADPHLAFSAGNYLAGLPEAWLEVTLLALAQGLVAAGRRRSKVQSTRSQEDSRSKVQGGDGGGGAGPGWGEFAGLLAVSLFIVQTNSHAGPHSETPLLGSWLFVLAGAALRPAGSGRLLPRLPVLGVLGAVVWVHAFGTGAASLAWSLWPGPTALRQRVVAGSPRFDAAPLASLRVYGLGGEPALPGTYADEVNDGLRLLRKLGGVHRVEALDFVNPFPFALQWPPARGGMWSWQSGVTFSAAVHPAPGEVFRDADVVMVPKLPGVATTPAVLWQIYGPYLQAHYALADESAQWFVLRKR